jgi:3-hydroxybutyryl-CoA dehydrogenase
MSAPLTVAVLGAGLMGHGVAWLFAAGGHSVRVYDAVPAALAALPGRLAAIDQALGSETGVMARVTAEPDMAKAVSGADVVIEAAPENLVLKRDLFEKLDALAPSEALLASNTSVIPIGRIAERVRDKSRVLGAHFWNPPHLVPLVEVVTIGPENLPAAERMIGLLASLGRKPVLVKRDIPGFIGNRLQHALKREAIALVANGVCDAETVDEVVKLGFGARLAVLGPLEQSDLVGLDLTKAIHETVMPDLDVTPTPHPYLEALVAKGDLGMKTGKGFREWTPQEADAARARLSAFLLSGQRLAAGRQQSDVARGAEKRDIS